VPSAFALSTLSRDEVVSIAGVAVTVFVLTWYQTDTVGGQRLTDAVVALLVSVCCAVAVTVVLKSLDPGWYSP
jgi:Mn2+/Fe2+ NRAMP family transporter